MLLQIYLLVKSTQGVKDAIANNHLYKYTAIQYDSWHVSIPNLANSWLILAISSLRLYLFTFFTTRQTIVDRVNAVVININATGTDSEADTPAMTFSTSGSAFEVLTMTS